MRKTRIGIIFGGKSVEHEVSLQSAKNIISAINLDKYEIVLIGMDKSGKWYLNDSSHYLLNESNPKLIQLNNSKNELALIPGESKNQIITKNNNEYIGTIDVAFPVLHGPYGEDGTIQGLLKLANIPFIGASVLGSAIGMDKDVTKRLLRDAGILIPQFIAFTKPTRANYDEIKMALGPVLIVKPANLGSSVGINKVTNEDEFYEAVEIAFQFDRKILVEECISGREIEIAVLGNEDPIASIPGEVIPKNGFYSYEAKYIDEHGAVLEIPAKLDKEKILKIQEIAIKTFKTLCCEGMARVDFFLKHDGSILVNEINTIPGFTNISMYPKLWETSGISYCELIERLIQLALERNGEENKLKTEY